MRQRRRIPKSARYKVGYGKPPKETRFKKGLSGNPKGRPKGRANMRTVIRTALSQTIEVKEGGRPRKVSRREAVFMAMLAKAMKGDIRAVLEILKIADELDLEDEKRDSSDAKNKATRALAIAAQDAAMKEATDEEVHAVARYYKRVEKIMNEMKNKS